MQLEQAWAHYSANIKKFIAKRVACRADLDDVLQEVFLALTEAAQKSNFPKYLSSWLYQVARHKIADLYRQRIAENHNNLNHEASFEPVQSEPILELVECLPALLTLLPDNYKQILQQADLAEDKYNQIAQQFNLSLPAVKARVLRARKHLLNRFLQCCDFQYNQTGQIVDFKKKITTTVAAQCC